MKLLSIKTAYETNFTNVQQFIAILDEETQNEIRECDWLYKCSSREELLFYFTDYCFKTLHNRRDQTKLLIDSIRCDIESYILDAVLKGKKCIIHYRDWSIVSRRSYIEHVKHICDENSLFLESIDDEMFIISLKL